MARRRTDVAVTKARAPLSEDFGRMRDELAAAGRGMSESELESLISEAVAESRRKARPARKSRNIRSRKR